MISIAELQGIFAKGQSRCINISQYQNDQPDPPIISRQSLTESHTVMPVNTLHIVYCSPEASNLRSRQALSECQVEARARAQPQRFSAVGDGFGSARLAIN